MPPPRTPEIYAEPIEEYEANLGKDNFFLLVEVVGGCGVENLYLDVLKTNLNAATDIGFTFNEPKEPGPRVKNSHPK